MKIQITHEHLRRALAQPWSPTTCLLAQAIMEQLEPGDMLSSLAISGRTVRGKTVRLGNTAVALRRRFDEACGWDIPENIAKLKAQLPQEVEIDIE